MISADRETVRLAASAAFRNANRLLADAEMLLHAGSAPTAHAVAILAMEEAAKAVTWRRFADADTGQTVRFAQERHEGRLQRVRHLHNYLEMWFHYHHDPDYELPTSEAFDEKIRREATSDNARKQRGFYVDVEKTTVLEPTLITDDEAREACDVARLTVALSKSVIMEA